MELILFFVMPFRSNFMNTVKTTMLDYETIVTINDKHQDALNEYHLPLECYYLTKMNTKHLIQSISTLFLLTSTT